jgi:hypothetical protein
MSGTPKYCQAELDRQRREQLEQERRRQAAEETRRRREAEERERKRRLEEIRAGLVSDGGAALQAVKARRNEMHSQDAIALEMRCEKLIAAIRVADAEKLLRAREGDIHLVTRDLSEAAARKRRDDAEKKRLAEIDHQRFLLQEVERRLSEISLSEAAKFDPQGAESVKISIGKAHATLAAGNPEGAKRAVQQAEDAFKKHAEQVSLRREEWQRQKNEAGQCVEELRAHVEGLRADPVLARWHRGAVSEMGSFVSKAAAALAVEQFKQPAEIWTDVQGRSKRLIEEANQAQLKADQRDYIMNSIAQTLSAMDFLVSPISAEHAGHPASAMLLQAVRGANKNIYVSVPFEGQVMYTVDGYPMKTANVVGGGKAPICDEAEKVLVEMQEKVQAAFGVKMSTLWWQDKVDPDRVLRAAGAKDEPNQQARGRQ